EGRPRRDLEHQDGTQELMPLLSSSPIEGRLDVACEYADRELIKTIPGARWDANRKTWHVPQTWAAYVQLHGTFRDRMTISPEVNEWARPEYERVEAAKAWRSVIESG